MALQINEGWLNVYKPLDITSSKVVQKITMHPSPGALNT